MIPASEMSEHLARMARSARLWLEDFSAGRHKRPDGEIEQKRLNASVLEQASHAYAAKAKKEQAA